jgi:crossover junction endodeoxyribonuclease RuvC
VVEVDGSRLAHVAHGTIQTSARHTQALRLQRIFRDLANVVREFEPKQISLEKVFLARNFQSALKLGQVRGVALLAAAERNIAVAEYTSVQIKKAVAGYGHAGKEQVQQMVASILKLADGPQEDAADALAAAICHSHQHNYQASILSAVSNKRRNVV